MRRRCNGRGDARGGGRGPGGFAPGPRGAEEPRSERRRSTQFGRSSRPRMSSLSEAATVARRAIAEAEVAVSQETLSAIVDGTVPRGEVLSVAELAGVMAAKRTPELIPLVHATPLTELLVVATPDRAAGAVRIKAETAAIVRGRGRDGSAHGRGGGGADPLRHDPRRGPERRGPVREAAVQQRGGRPGVESAGARMARRPSRAVRAAGRAGSHSAPHSAPRRGPRP